MDGEGASLWCCKCGCSCALTASSQGGIWIRSVKRKYAEYEEKPQFYVPGLDIPHVAHVEIENECTALREMVSNQQEIIEELSLELEEERNASSSAANEAMSMILRLQREKAEVQMEARQFKRFSEEKMAHDAEEVSALEELLYKREQAIQSLTCEVQAYKHRMMSFGLTESEAEGVLSDDGQNQIYNEVGVQVGSPSRTRNYPPLRCHLNDMQLIENDEDLVDIEKYPFVESSHGQDHLMNLDYRINQLERNPGSCNLDRDFTGSKNSLEKVIVQSPMWYRNPRRGPSYSPLACGRDMGPDYPIDSPRMATSFKKMDCVEELKKCHDASDMADEMIDRVYTIDSVHQGISHNNPKEMKVPGISEEFVTTPGGSVHWTDFGDTEAKKLYQRVQVLEADRESLKQTIMSMQTDKAQLVLLREIAQQLCKDMSTERRMPMKKQSPPGKFSFVTACKWFLSIVFWRKKSRQSKYIGLSANNVGLLGILDKGPLAKHWSDNPTMLLGDDFMFIGKLTNWSRSIA
ncbi:hypothetical protein V2J09_004372 [Rumex salicifolius]